MTVTPQRAAQRQRSSWDVVRAAQHGDRAAVGALYHRYRGWIHRYLLSRTRAHDVADDLTSETFLRLICTLGSVRDQGKDVRAWLATIARNLAVDHQRSGSARREVPVGPSVEGTRMAESAENAVLLRQLQTEVQSALATLTPSQRECVFLRFYCGFSVAQTAAWMDSTSGATRALQYRALRILAVALRESVAEPDGPDAVAGAA